MTFSIVGRDPDAGKVGVAIASVFPAVGAVCPYVGDGVAIASQAWDSGRTYGESAVQMVEDGISLDTACQALIDERDGAEGTQLHGVSLAGDAFRYTGRRCVEWAGDAAGENYTAAGNMLAGPDVLAAAGEAFEGTDSPLEERLLAALAAGEEAGGDKRGDNLSAALLVRGPEPKLCHNLRVDDPGDPIAGLYRAHETAVETQENLESGAREMWGSDYPESITNYEIKD